MTSLKQYIEAIYKQILLTLNFGKKEVNFQDKSEVLAFLFSFLNFGIFCSGVVLKQQFSWHSYPFGLAGMNLRCFAMLQHAAAAISLFKVCGKRRFFLCQILKTGWCILKKEAAASELFDAKSCKGIET